MYTIMFSKMDYDLAYRVDLKQYTRNKFELLFVFLDLI